MNSTYQNEYCFNYLLSEFLTSYCCKKRNLSTNTIHSYATTFKFFIQYCINIECIKIEKINFDIIDDELIKRYLDYVENKNSISTRNQRLAAFKSFYQYVMTELPSQLFNGFKILKIPKKKTNKPIIDYISQEALSLVFDQPDITTKKGRNDLVILTTLYDTACRISEFLNIKLKDIHFASVPYIEVYGKGRKKRIVTVREDIKNNLEKYIYENNIIDNDQYLFSHNGKVYTRQGITSLIAKYVNIAKKEKDIFPKKYTPHIFRHSKAMHLLQNGATLEEIQDYLGHEFIETTRVYAKYNIEQQNKALEKATSNLVNTNLDKWKNDENILTFLNNL